MMAALLYSTKECEGPRVARRNFTKARISGGTDEDIIRIGNVVCAGPNDLPIENEGEMIQVLHEKASGEPVSVMLVP